MYIPRHLIRGIKEDATSNDDKKVDKKYPINYQTCMNLWNMLTNSVLTISGA